MAVYLCVYSAMLIFIPSTARENIKQCDAIGGEAILEAAGEHASELRGIWLHNNSRSVKQFTLAWKSNECE